MTELERITIRAFAGVEAASIDVARVTALIGPQASGKSITAKLLYFFRGIWQSLYYSFDSDLDADSRKEYVKDQFRKYFPPETWGKEVFTVQYEFGETKVLLRRAPSRGKPSDGLILYLPSFADDLFEKLSEFTAEAVEKARTHDLGYRRYEAWRRLEPELKLALHGHYFSSQLFVPAGRAFFSNIENNVFSFISRSEKKLDPFLTEFGEYFSYVKSGGLRRSNKKEFATPLAEGLLGGALVIDKEKEFVRTRDGRSLPLSNLSSGQQEALPLLLMLEGNDEEFPLGRGSQEHRHASYIEEPEAHLFPDFQKKVSERIAEYAFSKNGAQSVFITTHSPYVLSTFNNLLLAGSLGLTANRAQQKRISEIVPQSRWLAAGSVAAYSFNEKGCQSIIDEKSGLIDAEYLDSVSTSIASTFESLLEVAFPGSEVISS